MILKKNGTSLSDSPSGYSLCCAFAAQNVLLIVQRPPHAGANQIGGVLGRRADVRAEGAGLKWHAKSRPMPSVAGCLGHHIHPKRGTVFGRFSGARFGASGSSPENP